VFSSFSFADATGSSDWRRNKNKRRKEHEVKEWMDGLARCGLSCDGIPIIYSIPNILNGPIHVRVSKSAHHILWAE
jgi:hypothetical protein